MTTTDITALLAAYLPPHGDSDPARLAIIADALEDIGDERAGKVREWHAECVKRVNPAEPIGLQDARSTVLKWQLMRFVSRLLTRRCPPYLCNKCGGRGWVFVESES